MNVFMAPTPSRALQHNCLCAYPLWLGLLLQEPYQSVANQSDDLKLIPNEEAGDISFLHIQIVLSFAGCKQQ